MVGLNKPMCLICNEAVSAVTVCNLKRHYESKHKEFHNKEKSNSMLLSYKQGSSMKHRGSSAQDKCTEASLRVSWILCNNMIPFAHAEVVRECTLQSVKVIEGEETSNDTATRRCNELANNINCQLVSELSQSICFSLAADESTDISDIARFSRFVEELLGLVPLYGRTTGKIISNEISKLLASQNQQMKHQRWRLKKKGLVGKLKQINSCINPYHCIIYNTVLWAKLRTDFSPIAY
ncbi:hypothetical protein PR048_019209 [Dryococelus australis]|uniref:Uncharacterized protein n=1 Tax=Dryococelus australis TaxID=614101 RepID=A0ABQ9H2W5_9NEOP|nr:hypothetical protein PR048_019209 [Dryococelus australis]